jgi:hypothetical protein
MTAALAFLTSPIGAYIVSRLGSKLMREHGGTLWFKIGSVLFKRFLKPKKTDAQNLLDRLDAEGVKLTKAQRAKLSQEDQDLIDHV